MIRQLKSPVVLLALGAVAAVAALEAWQGTRAASDELVQPAARFAARPGQTQDSAPRVPERPMRERLSSEVIGEPFGAREPPRPVAASFASPTAPAAAPFPYRYGGQLSLGDGERRVYLTKGNDLLMIQVGDVLDGIFKVTRIDDDALEVLHVPSSVATLMQYSAMTADAAAPAASRAGAGQVSALSPTSQGSVASAAVAPQVSGTGTIADPFVGAGVGGASAVTGAAPGAPSLSPVAGGSTAVTAGTIPQGRLGSAGPSAGAPQLGIAPSGSNSMPLGPAPVGIMRTLPPPTGRLGI